MYGGPDRGAAATSATCSLDPRHPYTLGLVRSAPDVEYVRESLVPIPGSPPSLIAPPVRAAGSTRGASFAEEDCTVTPTPLRPLPGGRATACLHYERCLDAVAADQTSHDRAPACPPGAAPGPIAAEEPLLSARESR